MAGSLPGSQAFFRTKSTKSSRDRASSILPPSGSHLGGGRWFRPLGWQWLAALGQGALVEAHIAGLAVDTASDLAPLMLLMLSQHVVERLPGVFHVHRLVASSTFLSTPIACQKSSDRSFFSRLSSWSHIARAWRTASLRGSTRATKLCSS